MFTLEVDVCLLGISSETSLFVKWSDLLVKVFNCLHSTIICALDNWDFASQKPLEPEHGGSNLFPYMVYSNQLCYYILF